MPLDSGTGRTAHDITQRVVNQGQRDIRRIDRKQSFNPNRKRKGSGGIAVAACYEGGLLAADMPGSGSSEVFAWSEFWSNDPDWTVTTESAGHKFVGMRTGLYEVSVALEFNYTAAATIAPYVGIVFSSASTTTGAWGPVVAPASAGGDVRDSHVFRWPVSSGDAIWIEGGHDSSDAGAVCEFVGCMLTITRET